MKKTKATTKKKATPSCSLAGKTLRRKDVRGYQKSTAGKALRKCAK